MRPGVKKGVRKGTEGAVLGIGCQVFVAVVKPKANTKKPLIASKNFKKRATTL